MSAENSLDQTSRRARLVARGLLAAALVLAMSALSAGSPPGNAAAVVLASDLSYSVNGGFGHNEFVAGQGLTLTGQLPVAGQRHIWVESNMNRPGDVWTRQDGYLDLTNPDGSFSTVIQAPGMWGISFRVVGEGGYNTPGVLLTSKSQEVAIWVAGVHPNDMSDPGFPVAGEPFTLMADTTPTLLRRNDIEGTPVFQGRVLTLQEKISETEWSTLTTTTVGANGKGSFPELTQAEGDTVYRVIAEDWNEDGSKVGWYPSFPTLVNARSPLDPEPNPVSGSPIPRLVNVPRSPAAPTGTAASNYGWYPLYWDYAWERGEDLDSLPKRGSRMRGQWIQWTSGLGRVSKHQGGLRVDSGRLVQDGSGDFGTTHAILIGNAAKYGRWESRLRIKTQEIKDNDYKIKLELVPVNDADYNCGRRTITIASYTGIGKMLTIGVNADDQQWRRTISATSLADTIPALGVEVAKGHITWFLNGRPIGTVNNAAAVSDVPMTMRVSLEATGNGEHNSTSVYSDWQRGFPISSGRKVTSGAALDQSPLTSCVD